MVEADNGGRGTRRADAPGPARGALRERMARRLDELQAEYRAGRKVQADLQAEQAKLDDTLLRISGAVQVLEELLGADGEVDDGPPGQVDPAGTDLARAGDGILDPEG